MRSSSKDLTVRQLFAEDAAEISALLAAQPADDLRFFYAFHFDVASIERMLGECTDDVYSGLFWQGRLVGVLMLRGWDAGYEWPSFGIVISRAHRGRGLLEVSLEVAKSICRLSGAPGFMVKLHPDNGTPRFARKIGLVQTGYEAETGNYVYRMSTTNA